MILGWVYKLLIDALWMLDLNALKCVDRNLETDRLIVTLKYSYAYVSNSSQL